MNILIIHEIDWFKKIIFEPHHLAELFSLKGNNVYVIDCKEPDVKNFFNGFHTSVVANTNRIHDGASISVISPPSLLLKGLNRFTNYLTCKKIIYKISIEKKIDIILLYGTATNGVQTIDVAKQLSIPVIFRVLDIAHGLVRIPLLRSLAKKSEKTVIQNAFKVLTTTPELARYAIQMGAKKNNVKPFSLGINIKDFKPQGRDSSLAESLGIGKDDKVIVFMGTLYDFSGLDNIIKKFSIFKTKVSNVKLLIVGGGPALQNLQNLIKTKKMESHVKITGFIPQNKVPRYIALADVCINSFQVNYVTDSILPTKILEYFACGKPVLSTPLSGTKEILPNEDFGIVYAETQNFVDVLLDLLQNKEKLNRLGEKGYSYVKENHDWENLSKQLLEEFQNVIKKNS